MDSRMINHYTMLFFSCLLSGITSIAMKPPAATAPRETLVLAHKKLASEKLHLKLEPEFEQKSVHQLRALLEQNDTFSCAYRTLFHARCIEIANKRSQKGLNFDESIKELLLNKGMMNSIYLQVKDYLNSERKSWDQAKGVDMCFIPGICSLKVRKLYGKILTTFLEDDGKKLTVLHDEDASSSNPLAYSHDFIKYCGSSMIPLSQCTVDIDQSSELEYQLSKLKKPFGLAHFICRYPNHAFLVTMRSDAEKNASVYVIDSNNENIAKSSQYKAIVSKLMVYTQMHNAQQLTEKQNSQSQMEC